MTIKEMRVIPIRRGTINIRRFIRYWSIVVYTTLLSNIYFMPTPKAYLVLCTGIQMPLIESELVLLDYIWNLQKPILLHLVPKGIDTDAQFLCRLCLIVRGQIKGLFQ